jgi:putative component of membrane protein insertase Oxa1/YidC/SpoIIIJ protein YidD
MSCSEYMIKSIEKYGIFYGLYHGMVRLVSCHPLTTKSYYDAP